ncbi:MAG: hypothetical protein EP343_28250 [Deltaproteobacteria bacterium]|nr:MAG: hypothetical protein EP343_28250 [Deltaproteobacteria bacterium]
MNQEELKLGEACRAARRSLVPEIKAWVKSVVDDALKAEAHSTDTLKKTLEDSLHKRIVPDLVNRAMHEVQKADLFNEEQRLTLREQVNFWLKAWRPTIPVTIQQPLFRLNPLPVALSAGVLGSIGLIVGMALSPTAWVPGVACLLSATLGSLALSSMAQNQEGAPQGWTAWWMESIPTQESGSLGPHSMMELMAQISLHHVLSLVEAAGRLEMLHQESSPVEPSDSLEMLFDRCKDGLAEAYYSDLKRDPERALDACIKLVSDLQGMGVEVVTVERGTEYTPALDDCFAPSGSLNEGDPVVMLFPAWKLQGELLSRGLLKRSRRRASQ